MCLGMVEDNTLPITTTDTAPADPIKVEDAAAVLVERGWAPTYEAAREDLEWARAAVLAEAIGADAAVGADPMPRTVQEDS